MATLSQRVITLAQQGNNFVQIAAELGITPQEVAAVLRDQDHQLHESGASGPTPDEKWALVADESTGASLGILRQGASLLLSSVNKFTEYEDGFALDPAPRGFPQALEDGLFSFVDTPDALYWIGDGAKIGRAVRSEEVLGEPEESWLTAFEGALEPAHEQAVNAIWASDTHLYWLTIFDEIGKPAAIGRCLLDGSELEPEWLVVGGTTRALSTDDTYIYWLWEGSEPVAPRPMFIGRVKLDGTGLDPEWLALGTWGVGLRTGIGVTSNHIYWAQSGVRPLGIGRADLDGSNMEANWLLLQYAPSALGVGPDFGEQFGEHVWWLNRYGIGHLWVPTKDA